VGCTVRRLGGIVGAFPDLRRFAMGEQKESKPGWAERRREKKRLKLERTGDSPAKQTERERKSTSADEGASRAASGNVAGGGIL
jgi:hypothetical protein